MDAKKWKNWVDIIVSLLVYALAIFVFVASASFKPTADASLNPDVWPRIIAVLMCLVATVQLMNALRGRVTTHVVVANPKEVLCAIALIILYSALLKPVGYIVCSIVLMVCLLRLFHTKGLWIYLVLPVATTLVTYYCFHNLLRVPLPEGLLAFLG